MSRDGKSEENKFSSIQAKHQEQGALFIDRDFPPSFKSLVSDIENAEKEDLVNLWKDMEWIRAREIPSLNDDEGKLQVFAGSIEPNDIRQGALGDCYFLSVLSVLAEKPERVRKLFETTEVNQEGVFAMNLTKNGQKVQVIVDEYFPCKDKEPFFSSANGNELWVLLLEKAWAKLHGSY